MSESERLEGLRAALNESAGAYLDETSFLDWQGKCFGLLGFNIIHQARFRDHAERIVEEHEFHSNLLRPEVRERQLKLEGILSQAIGELESNNDSARPATTRKPRTEELKQKEKPSKIPHTILDKEQGMLWYWHHCHFTVKWKIIGSVFGLVVAVFVTGVAAGRNQFFQQLWDLFKTIYQNP